MNKFPFSVILIFCCVACASGETSGQAGGSSPLENFQTHTISIRPEDKSRFFDCIDESKSSMPVPFQIRNEEFNYFRPKPVKNLFHGIMEVGKWPVVMSLLTPEKTEKSPYVFVTLRGDTFGYHKSFVTKPYLEYMKSKRLNDYMLFLDEYTFINKFGDYKKDNIMSFCHDRPYWFRNILFEYPGFEDGGSWNIINKIFPSKQKFIFLSYSNGTIPRMEFINRKMNAGYKPAFFAIKNQNDFLKEYIANTTLENERSREIKGFIDIEGNFYRGKALWDILAYIKDIIEKDENLFYYSIVRVNKPDAFPVQVTMIQVLNLQGVEGDDGIIRYSNEKGNVIIEVIPAPNPPYYGNKKIDLRTATQFKVSDSKAKDRKFIPHLNLATYTIDRFSKIPWPKSASID
jgi:hypothetical protein